MNKFLILTYNIGFITKSVDSLLKDGVNENDIIWLKHKYRDRFFADPFLLKRDNDYYYVLAEEYKFWDEKGCIVLLQISKKDYSLKKRYLLIKEKWHLSFPFCEEDSDYIIPESIGANKTYRYKIDFSQKKIIEKKQLINEGIIDGVYFDNLNYLFGSKAANPKSDLYEYIKTDNGYTCYKKIIESDFANARSAGRFFVNNGTLYRPAQNCVGRYGKQLNIQTVSKSGDNFVFNNVKTINSEKNPPYNETMHTFNVYNDIIVVDGSIDENRFFGKIFFKLSSKTCRLFRKLKK